MTYDKPCQCRHPRADHYTPAPHRCRMFLCPCEAYQPPREPEPALFEEKR